MGRTRQKQQRATKVSSGDDYSAAASSTIVPQTRNLDLPPVDSGSESEEDDGAETKADPESQSITTEEEQRINDVAKRLTATDLSGQGGGRDRKREMVHLDGTTLEGGGQLGMFFFLYCIVRNQWA